MNSQTFSLIALIILACLVGVPGKPAQANELERVHTAKDPGVGTAAVGSLAGCAVGAKAGAVAAGITGLIIGFVAGGPFGVLIGPMMGGWAMLAGIAGGCAVGGVVGAVTAVVAKAEATPPYRKAGISLGVGLLGAALPVGAGTVLLLAGMGVTGIDQHGPQMGMLDGKLILAAAPVMAVGAVTGIGATLVSWWVQE